MMPTLNVQHRGVRDKMFNGFSDLLSIADLQAALGVGRSTAYRLIHDGSIKHLRIGRSVKVPKCYLVDFVSKSCYDDGETGCDTGKTIPNERVGCL